LARYHHEVDAINEIEYYDIVVSVKIVAFSISGCVIRFAPPLIDFDFLIAFHGNQVEQSSMNEYQIDPLEIKLNNILEINLNSYA
jgi:hypothetical protein